MDSRDKDQSTPHHPPHLSSLVVRPSASEGADGGGSGGRPTGNDYEPGEVRRDMQQYSRSSLYNDESGYRIRAGSSSPLRQRDTDRHYGMNYDRSGGSSRSREYDDRREFSRYRDTSPAYSRRPGAGRPVGRGFGGPGLGPRPLRGEGMGRNNPNVRPREGDWMCPECGNLNFARREYCNSCQRFRHAPAGSPRRGYPGPTHPHSSRRLRGPPLDLSPHRNMNTYRSPPRSWERDGPRDFAVGAMPPVRYEGTFSDHMHRDKFEYLGDEYRRPSKFDRPMPMDWGHRDNGRDGYFGERKGYERHPPSPPLAPAHPAFSPPHSRWTRDPRERSRSPVRGLPPRRDYRRSMFIERARDGRRVGRNRIGDAY